MAIAAVRAGKIKENASKDEQVFAAPLPNWIEWAMCKELAIPETLQKAYDELKKKGEQEQRTKKSFRPGDEYGDKIAVVAVMKVINAFVPELPIAQLVNLKPIRELLGTTRYTKDTLIIWANQEGITNPPGRPHKERKKICMEKIPKEWGFSWN
jgi:hypothetical protein